MPVKLILRNQEYEVRPGMTLRDSLQKIGVDPESVLATRQGEMITDDEILIDGEEIKLVAVISGGSNTEYGIRNTLSRNYVLRIPYSVSFFGVSDEM